MTGKNVPENRNNGIIPNRNTRANDVSLVHGDRPRLDRRRKGKPGQHRDRHAASTHGVVMAPNAAITARKMAEFMASRKS